MYKTKIKVAQKCSRTNLTPWLVQRAGQLFSQEISAEGKIIRLPDTNLIFHIVTYPYVAVRFHLIWNLGRQKLASTAGSANNLSSPLFKGNNFFVSLERLNSVCWKNASIHFVWNTKWLGYLWSGLMVTFYFFVLKLPCLHQTGAILPFKRHCLYLLYKTNKSSLDFLIHAHYSPCLISWADPMRCWLSSYNVYLWELGPQIFCGLYLPDKAYIPKNVGCSNWQ